LGGQFPHDFGENAVRPLFGVVVEESVELVHHDALGVQLVDFDPVELLDAVQFAHGLGETLDDGGLPAHGVPHDHKSVSHHYRVVQLDALVHELALLDPVVLLATLGNRVQNQGVLPLWQFDPWEQVRGDASEQRDVVQGELRQVHVHERDERQDVFFFVHLPFELSGRC